MEIPGVWAKVGFAPCSPEQEAVLSYEDRFVLLAGGERAGKSYLVAKLLLLRCAIADGLFWLVGPDYEQTRAEMAYLVEDLDKIGAILGKPSLPERGSQKVTTMWGARIVSRTSAELMRLASEAPDGILMTECGQQQYGAWLRCRGRVAQKRGWVIMSGTFEGSLGWYPEMFTRWQGANPEGGKSFSLPSWSNTIIYPGGRQDPEILSLEATYPKDLFLERLAAVPCPPSGLVFKEFSYTTHVQEWCEYDPDLPVWLWIDPGFNHNYACIAVQRHGPDVWCVDEIYGRGLTTEDVIRIAKDRPWYEKFKGGVIDIAGRQHQAMASHIEIWLARTGRFLSSNKVSITDGIERMRTILKDPAAGYPRIYFNPALIGTFAEFGKYVYADNSSDKPIDRDNDAMKALAYGLYAEFGPVKRKDRKNDPGKDPYVGITGGEPEVTIAKGTSGLKFKRVPKKHNTLRWR